MVIECLKCNSKNINKYNNGLVCFDCKFKDLKEIKKKEYIKNSSFNNKLSGNTRGQKRYFVGNTS